MHCVTNVDGVRKMVSISERINCISKRGYTSVQLFYVQDLLYNLDFALSLLCNNPDSAPSVLGMAWPFSLLALATVNGAHVGVALQTIETSGGPLELRRNRRSFECPA